MAGFDLLTWSGMPSKCEARRKLSIEPGAAVVLFFGQIRPNKGLEVLLRAFPHVLRAVPSARILAGGFPLAGMREVTELVADLRLRPFTYLLPRYIPLEEVPLFFQAADVVAMPYLRTTQSGVLPAAMAFGKAVVASSVGALAEVVKDGESGLVVPPGQPEPLAEAIIRLLTSERLREEMARNLKEAGQKIFTWPKAAEATEALYREVVSRR
jgi:glycosyltransferase involved in cell wall biosynthesis